MANIGSLVVSLIAKTGLFDRNMKRSRRQMSFFARQAQATRHMIMGLGARIIAFAGIAGLGYMIKQTMAAIDATAKLADQLQIGTEALKGFELAAKINGASMQDMQKGLQMMTRRLAETKAGIGQAKYGLDAMGLSARDLIMMGPEEAFLTIADSISQMASASDKAFAAYNMFGRGGMQLLNMLNKGRAGLEAYRKEAEKLGIAFSRYDASKVEAANDAITRAKAVLEGLRNTLVIELAPAVEAMATGFTEWANSGEGAASKLENIFKRLALTLAHLADKLEDIFKGKNLSDYILGPLDRSGNAMPGVNQLKMMVFFSEMEKKAADFRAKMAADAAARQGVLFSQNDLELETQRLEMLFKTADQIWKDTRTPLENFIDKMDELDNLIMEGVISWDTYLRAGKKAIEDLHGAASSKSSYNAGQFEVVRESLVSVKGLDSGRMGTQTYQSKSLMELQKQTGLLTTMATKEGLN